MLIIDAIVPSLGKEFIPTSQDPFCTYLGADFQCKRLAFLTYFNLGALTRFLAFKIYLPNMTHPPL
jgi:hypothetical protein